jgi:hypothetical protein
MTSSKDILHDFKLGSHQSIPFFTWEKRQSSEPFLRQSSLCGLPAGQRQSSAICILSSYGSLRRCTDALVQPQVPRKDCAPVACHSLRLFSLRQGIRSGILAIRRASYANRVEYQNALYISYIKISSVILVSHFTSRLHTKTLIHDPWLFPAFYSVIL